MFKFLLLGCDSGFGLELAIHLHEKGVLVFAGCLFKDGPKPSDGAKQLQEMNSPNLHVVQLDVTKDEDWDAVVEYITKHSYGKFKKLCKTGVINYHQW